MLKKEDAKMAQGLAIFAMVMLHLFCRKTDLPYDVHLYVGNTPLIYYFGLFGDICVPIYCFCSGYAQILLMEKDDDNYRKNSLKRAWKFLKHFWLVVIIFAIVGLFGEKRSHIPGNWITLLGNLSLIRLTYNGAWWFVTTYLLLLLIAPLCKRVLEKFHPIMACGISGVIYLASYVFRFHYTLEFGWGSIEWIWNQLILLGTSQFGFMVGMIFYKYHVIKKIREKLCEIKARRLVILALPVCMFIFHGGYQSLIVAPITAIVTLTCFHLWDKSEKTKMVFLFLGKHSTNIWLTHMFFYSGPFEDFVFVVRYPFFVLGLTLMVCVLTSFVINMIERRLCK